MAPWLKIFISFATKFVLSTINNQKAKFILCKFNFKYQIIQKKKHLKDIYYETKLLSGVIIQNKYGRPYQNTRDFRNNKRLTRVEELILKTNII